MEQQQNLTIVQGELHDARYTIAIPHQHNNCLLIYCHGCRPVGWCISSTQTKTLTHNHKQTLTHRHEQTQIHT